MATLQDIVAYANEAESPWPRDLGEGLNSDARNNEPPPWNEVLGPTRPRGGPAGLVRRGGDTLIEWGDIDRVDMTFSVTKSFLALLAGIAVGDGLIADLDDPVHGYALDDGFDSAQNRTITWRHLLQQTSEWEGTLFDKPDLVDRNRSVNNAEANQRKGTHRDLGTPGSHWEYNDVRVNRLSLSLLHLFKRPLPEVLAERIMRPIGASDTWEWLAYRNATVDVEGVPIASVPGGGHWGGGLFISARDLARVGELVRAHGMWGGEAVLPSGWTEALREPCALNPTYGLLWWLNTEQRYRPSAPASSYFAFGAGSNVIWIDEPLELVAVIRWIDGAQVDGFIRTVLSAI
ncbi:MAG: serine hydrolase [Pseudomonadota bacterium]